MQIDEQKLPSDRNFGIFFFFIFLLLSIYFFSNEVFFSSFIFFSASLIFLTISLTKSRLLHPLNKLWIKLGLILGRVISPIVIGILFFLFFTPIALVMRVFGRDELSIKFESRSSYWKKRTEQEQIFSRFKNQF